MSTFEPEAHPRADAGQFVEKPQSAPDVQLTTYSRMEQPITPLSLQHHNSPSSFFTARRNALELDPPYQRGSVWSEEQQRGLIRSLILELPIGTIALNFRGYATDTMWNVIDGKQRIQAIRAFVDDELTVPRDWFADEGVSEVKHDRTSVVFSELSLREKRRFDNHVVPYIESRVETVQAEAEVFRLLNSGGTPQTEATLARASEVEKS